MQQQPDDQQEWVSKTRRKKEMHDLQDLGMQLARLSGDTLKKIELPEELRETLLENDDSLTDFLRDYPAAEAGQLRTLIRNTRKEREQAKPPKHFRALYRYLKEAMDADNPAADVPEEEDGQGVEQE